jgi:hypothetical protein
MGNGGEEAAQGRGGAISISLQGNCIFFHLSSMKASYHVDAGHQPLSAR